MGGDIVLFVQPVVRVLHRAVIQFVPIIPFFGEFCPVFPVVSEHDISLVMVVPIGEHDRGHLPINDLYQREFAVLGEHDGGWGLLGAAQQTPQQGVQNAG